MATYDRKLENLTKERDKFAAALDRQQNDNSQRARQLQEDNVQLSHRVDGALHRLDRMEQQQASDARCCTVS